jgi:hypothetical protein
LANPLKDENLAKGGKEYTDYNGAVQAGFSGESRGSFSGGQVQGGDEMIN